MARTLPPPAPSVRGILRALDRQRWRASGARLFDDFLTVLELRLGTMPETEDPRGAHARLVARYGDLTVFDDASTAFAGAIGQGPGDYLGETYMQLGANNTGYAQFFTPWPLCVMMAELQATADLVHTRLRAAIAAEPLAASALLAGQLLTGDAALGWFLMHIIPAAIASYDRVTVYDPACGSGAMLLAAASTVPWWMVHMGLVTFLGQDIDGTCVQMARIQLRCIGANGAGVAGALAWADAQLTAPLETPIPVAPLTVAAVLEAVV